MRATNLKIGVVRFTLKNPKREGPTTRDKIEMLISSEQKITTNSTPTKRKTNSRNPLSRVIKGRGSCTTKTMWIQDQIKIFDSFF
jgi:hypothetical protein